MRSTRISAVLVALCILCLSPVLFADTTGDSATSIDTSVIDSAGQIRFAASTEEALYPLSAERYEKLVSYSRFNNIWRFVSFFVGIAILSILLFSGLSARFRDWASRVKVKFFAVWVFLILIMVADYLLGFPVHVYRRFFVEQQYGFLNQTFMQWWGEDLLGLLVGLILGIIPMWFFYWLVNRIRKWWLVFSIGAVPLAIFLIVIAPVLISPLFNDFVPLEDKALEAKILALADKAGIEGSDVFQVNASKQSSKLNAYVTGLFGTKRIVLYDTLIKNFTHDEIRFIMAHEMGHYVKHHIWWGLLVAILFIAGSLWLVSRTIQPVITRFRHRFRFDRLGDMASLPLVLIFLSVIMFVFQPITNGLSRVMERQADTYGMEMSGVSGETAATAFDKLSVFNLSDPDPHPIIEFWFYDHPSLKKRIAFVRGYQRW